MSYGQKPLGLREVVFANAAGDTFAALDAAQKLSMKERVSSNELRGNDRVVALVTYSEAVDLELELGGIPLDAYALMTGRTVTVSGTTPTEQRSYDIVGDECFPYFQVSGRAIGDDCQGDVHALFYKVKLTDGIEGEFADGQFFVTKATMVAVKDATAGKVGTIVQHETGSALPTS